MNKKEFIKRTGEIIDAAREVSRAQLILMQGEEGVSANIGGNLEELVKMLIAVSENDKRFKLVFAAFLATWADEEKATEIKNIVDNIVTRHIP